VARKLGTTSSTIPSEVRVLTCRRIGYRSAAHYADLSDTARKLWVPAVDAKGTFGRCGFLEITDPWDAQNTIRQFLAARGDYGD
jgi:hypothetical protein